MPCMVLHGDSNIGKTLIVARFEREHPDRFDEVKGVERRDVADAGDLISIVSTQPCCSNLVRHIALPRACRYSNGWPGNFCAGSLRGC